MSSLFSSLSDRLEVDMESLLAGQRQDQEEEEGHSYYNYNIANFRGFTSNDDDDDQSSDSNRNANDCLSCAFCPVLSWQERIGGCLGCMVLGYVLSFGSFFRFRDLLAGNPGPFVVYATVGNIISLSGSFFISGPTAQLKKMFHEKRIVATFLYLASLAITLIVALVPFAESSAAGFKAFILVVLFICQYIAVGWYCLSYIPFARQMASSVWNSILSRIMGFVDD